MPAVAHYIESYYTASANLQLDFPALAGAHTADVCVIGGGYTGLSSAIHLAERGYRVVLLEAERIAWGASRQPQEELEKRFGKEEAGTLWNLSVEAVDTVRSLIQRFGIQCDLKRGNLQVAAKQSDANWYRAHADHMRNAYA
jgi:gamma-glutamylputrescine oxidase